MSVSSRPCHPNRWTGHAGADGDDDTLNLVLCLGRAALEDGPAACILDREGNLVYANAAYEAIAASLAAAGIVPGPAAAGDEVYEYEVPTHGAARRFVVRRQAVAGKDGPALATVYRITPAAIPDTEPGRLAMAHERLDDITRLVSDWIWETNRNLVLTFVSPRVNEALGYHQVELVGRRLTDLPVARCEKLEECATARGRQPFRNLEVSIADRAGNVRHFLLSGLPMFHPMSGVFHGFRGTARDVTELKAREQALLHAKEAAEQASRTKSEFLSNMSHELRTPLNAIIGFSELMGEEMLGPLGSDQYRGYVRDITESARHLLLVINDILDAAKIESGHMRLTEDTLDPQALAESVMRLVAPRAERAKLALVVELPQGLPRLRADGTKLKQVLINLLSNAVKFTPTGGLVELRAAQAENGDFLFIVSDTGIGIAPEDMAVALAPFGQVDSRLSRKFQGTGLGLPLAKALVEMHDGCFEVVSEPDVGTTVTVRLPASRVLGA